MELTYQQFIQNLKLPDQGEIIFFPGSFNPLHQGHLELIKKLPVEKPLYVIHDLNPQKNFQSKPTELNEQISRVRNENIVINQDFIHLQIKNNYTYNWLSLIHQNYPQLKISLALGFDQLNNLENWFQAKNLIGLLENIYWLSRGESVENREEVIGQLKKSCPKINLISLGQHNYESISSTSLREKATLKND